MVIIENIAVSLFAALNFITGFAILAKNDTLINFFHLRTASRSRSIGIMSLFLGAFAVAALLIRLT
jgi:hypothetical protein